jgi:type II secretory pathway pseudopilin PulG
MKHLSSGFTTLESLLVVSVLAVLILLGVAPLATQPLQARSAAFELAAIVDAARSIAAANASSLSLPATASGSTVSVDRKDGHTIVRLFLGRPVHIGNLVEDTHLPPFITNASISVLSGKEIQPPFALLFSSGGYVSLAPAYDKNAHLPVAEVACPAEGYILEFRLGLHSEDHLLSCDSATLKMTN